MITLTRDSGRCRQRTTSECQHRVLPAEEESDSKWTVSGRSASDTRSLPPHSWRDSGRPRPVRTLQASQQRRDRRRARRRGGDSQEVKSDVLRGARPEVLPTDGGLARGPASMMMMKALFATIDLQPFAQPPLVPPCLSVCGVPQS